MKTSFIPAPSHNLSINRQVSVDHKQSVLAEQIFTVSSGNETEMGTGAFGTVSRSPGQNTTTPSLRALILHASKLLLLDLQVNNFGGSLGPTPAPSQDLRAFFSTDTSWTATTTQTYYGAEAFAFITFAELFLFFLALVVFQGAVTEQLGIGE